MMTGTKRPLTEEENPLLPDWWYENVHWIHDGSLQTSDQTTDDIRICPKLRLTEDRTLQTNDQIYKDELVFCIPYHKLVTLLMAHADISGLEQLDSTSSASSSTSASKTSSRKEFSKDVQLALYLAVKKEQQQQHGNAHKGSTVLPYLSTLPQSSTFDALPRRWPHSKQQRLLGGSPLLDRVQAQQKQAENDYKALKEHFAGVKGATNTNFMFPSFLAFSDMLAAVTSRAFCLNDGEIGMIPLLDLCNHARGKACVKNLQYQLDGMLMKVTAIRDISKDDPLIITYGAQGNGPLLLNYGFCIDGNLEPDGSSNDVLEWHIRDEGSINTTTIELRTGGKAYTYGPFVKCLEYFISQGGDRQRHANVNRDKNHDDDDADDDMEAFLNGCEEENEDEQMDGMGFLDDVPESACCDEGKSAEDYEVEMKSLLQMRKALAESITKYSMTGETLKKNCDKREESATHFASLLQRSEQRTLYFYQCASDKIRQNLANEQNNGSGEQNGQGIDSPKTAKESIVKLLSEDDLALIDEQADQLSKAYMQIRHGNNF